MDYKKAGLLLGLEIHQQLDTGKLFCHCPGYLRKDDPDFQINRRLHKVAGETGQIDLAVKYEASLGKQFIYQGYNDSTCLVELDEEPPHLINQRALSEALKIAFLMNCEIYTVSQIMRKTVIDGSNTSGFQRTVLIAHSGFIEISAGKIPIETIALEEDSARIISKEKKSSTYRLDRLGIPLVEITTAPVVATPEQIKEAALKIGEILRATRVKRGIGTIRQDVNVSIKNHGKVEIKGFQDPKILIKTIDLEIERQQKNLKHGGVGEVRNALPNGKTDFLRPLPGRDRMYPETDLPLLKISRDQINKIKKSLPKIKTEIKDELKKKGLTDELINLVLNNLDEFNTLAPLNKDANLIAKMITLWRSSENQTERILEQILEALKENKIEKSDVKEVMDKIAEDIPIDKALKIEKVSHDELEEEISKIIKSKPGLSAKAYMGLVMAKFKGQLDPKKAIEIILSILPK